MPVSVSFSAVAVVSSSLHEIIDRKQVNSNRTMAALGRLNLLSGLKIVISIEVQGIRCKVQGKS
jgi:hypothetical protein